MRRVIRTKHFIWDSKDDKEVWRRGRIFQSFVGSIEAEEPRITVDERVEWLQLYCCWLWEQERV